MLLLREPPLTTVIKVDCFLVVVSQKEIQRILKKVYNSYLLATISGLGLCVSKMSKFQDTKMAVIACLMSRRSEFAVAVREVMEMLKGG